MTSNRDIALKLRELNERLEDDSARVIGFRSWFDTDVDGLEVSVLWELETPLTRTWSLDRTDGLCALAAEALLPLGVANVYCAYRTDAEPADENDLAYWPTLERQAA